MDNNFSNPERILKELDVKEGARVADFGSGSGYFTLLLAKTVGQEGTITAVDVLESALSVVRTKAGDQGLHNINYIRGNLEIIGSSTLKNNSQDMVFLANILFQSQKKEEIVREAKRVLRAEGRLVIIDWAPSTIFGPGEAGWKLSQSEGRTLAEREGFTFMQDIPVSINHWGSLFKK